MVILVWKSRKSANWQKMLMPNILLELMSQVTKTEKKFLFLFHCNKYVNLQYFFSWPFWTIIISVQIVKYICLPSHYSAPLVLDWEYPLGPKQQNHIPSTKTWPTEQRDADKLQLQGYYLKDMLSLLNKFLPQSDHLTFCLFFADLKSILLLWIILLFQTNVEDQGLAIPANVNIYAIKPQLTIIIIHILNISLYLQNGCNWLVTMDCLIKL